MTHRPQQPKQRTTRTLSITASAPGLAPALPTGGPAPPPRCSDGLFTSTAGLVRYRAPGAGKSAEQPGQVLYGRAATASTPDSRSLRARNSISGIVPEWAPAKASLSRVVTCDRPMPSSARRTRMIAAFPADGSTWRRAGPRSESSRPRSSEGRSPPQSAIANPQAEHLDSVSQRKEPWTRAWTPQHSNSAPQS